MHVNNRLSSIERIGTGPSFIIFPIVFVFAFSVHPGLLHPHSNWLDGVLLLATYFLLGVAFYYHPA